MPGINQITNVTQVGPVRGADGAQINIRSTRDASTAVQDAHARYQEAVLRGGVYLAANQAGAAVTNLNATATGFILSNPAGSPVSLVLLEIGIVQTSTAAASANAGVQLAANVNPVAAAVVHTTPLTVRNAILGTTATGFGLADSSSTLPAAPVAVLNLWQPSVSATATTGIPPVVVIAVDGKIVVSPGCTVSLSALGALSCASHFVWEEVTP
jgi:hypothetical protein